MSEELSFENLSWSSGSTLASVRVFSIGAGEISQFGSLLQNSLCRMTTEMTFENFWSLPFGLPALSLSPCLKAGVVCCSVLQCVVVCCSAVCCGVLRCVVVCCSVLWCVALCSVYCSALRCCILLRDVVVCCSQTALATKNGVRFWCVCL